MSSRPLPHPDRSACPAVTPKPVATDDLDRRGIVHALTIVLGIYLCAAVMLCRVASPLFDRDRGSRRRT